MLSNAATRSDSILTTASFRARHHAEGWLWQPDRAASPAHRTPGWQYGLSGQELPTPCGPMELPRIRRQAHIDGLRGDRSPSRTGRQDPRDRRPLVRDRRGRSRAVAASSLTPAPGCADRRSAADFCRGCARQSSLHRQGRSAAGAARPVAPPCRFPEPRVLPDSSDAALEGWKARIIDCSEEFPEHLALPRGSLDEVVKLLERQRIWTTVRDERQPGGRCDFTFQGELTPDRREAAEAMAAHDKGVLAAPTAFGKTVIGAWLIAKRGVNTLVLVHRQQLADQCRERLPAFLDIAPRSIGQFG